jgi:uncharacterized protein (DUF4415 family)
MSTVIFDPRKAKPLTAQEVESLKKLCDRPIDLPDIPEPTEADWANAARGVFYRPVKQQISIRLDSDVLQWLRSKGRGYQSRINQILRSAMTDELNAKNSL